MSPTIEFWYEFASTYSYPAAMRIERIAKGAGVNVRWRPFLLGPLFNAQQGLKDSPFNVFPVKGRYMWRDMERICADENIPFRRPSAFPRNGLLAARLATLGAQHGWAAAFTRGVYTANFARDQDISDPVLLKALVDEAGGDSDAAMELAAEDAIKQTLRAATEEAGAKGVFGSPMFITADGELFWGNDRLERALAWANAHAKQKESA